MRLLWPMITNGAPGSVTPGDVETGRDDVRLVQIDGHLHLEVRVVGEQRPAGRRARAGEHPAVAAAGARGDVEPLEAGRQRRRLEMRDGRSDRFGKARGDGRCGAAASAARGSPGRPGGNGPMQQVGGGGADGAREPAANELATPVLCEAPGQSRATARESTGVQGSGVRRSSRNSGGRFQRPIAAIAAFTPSA